MKTEDVFIGKINKCTYLNEKVGWIPEVYGTEGQDGSILMGCKEHYEVKHENVLLYRFGLTNAWFYSPKYHKVLPTKPAQNGDLYVTDLHQFNYNKIQVKESISKLQIYITFRKFLKELVNPLDYYLVDIAYFYPGIELVYKRNVLARKLSASIYDCGVYGKISTEKNSVFGENLINIRPFDYNNINSQEYVTEVELKRTYNIYKETNNN